MVVRAKEKKTKYGKTGWRKQKYRERERVPVLVGG